MSEFSEFYENNDDFENDETYEIALPDDNRLKYLSDLELAQLSQSIEFRQEELEMLDYVVQREMDRRLIDTMMHIKGVDDGAL